MFTSARTFFFTDLKELSAKFLGMSETRFTCQVCMCYSNSSFRRWCNCPSLSKVLRSINVCEGQYSVLHFCVRHIKQQHIAFWDIH